MAVCQTIAALEPPAPIAQLVCCVCESQTIPAPLGASERTTRFTCRDCSRRIWRRKQMARAKLPVDPELAGGSRIPF
jgi:hypothetical protein